MSANGFGAVCGILFCVFTTLHPPYGGLPFILAAILRFGVEAFRP